MRRKLVLATTLTALVLSSPLADAADRSKIRGINIGAQAIVTLISGAIQGHVRTPRDVARCLLTGSVSGYGFYEAKAMVGRGNTQAGWVVANVAGSLSENVAAGKHPLAQLGYSIGPFRIRVPLGRLDPNADSYVLVDASEYEAIRLVGAIRDNDRAQFRSGMIAFERDTIYERDGNLITVGRTYGMFPGVWTGADSDTWAHEVVHAVQSLQMDSLEPPLPFLTYKPARDPNAPKRWIRFEFLKAGALNLSNDGITGKQRYQDRWFEIEAARLAQDRAPIAVD